MLQCECPAEGGNGRPFLRTYLPAYHATGTEIYRCKISGFFVIEYVLDLRKESTGKVNLRKKTGSRNFDKYGMHQVK